MTTINVQPNVSFNLNNVTMKNGGRLGGAAVELQRSRHSATISNVTFANAGCTALKFDNQTASSVTHSLSNMLFEGGRGQYFSTAHGIPSAIHTVGPVNLNINNITLRNEIGGNAAIGANDTYIGGNTATIGTITFSGCFTADGVYPRIWYGDIVDISTGPCSGAIGNGGSTAIRYPQAPAAACGMPAGGFVYGRRVFNLRGDCAPTSTLLIPYESDVVINGNGYTIDGSGVPSDPLAVSGRFVLQNVVVSGVNRYPILTYLDRNMRIRNSVFRDNAGMLALQDSVVSLENVLIENHQQSSSNLISGIFVNLSAQVTIRDSVFRNNSGGAAVLYTGPWDANRGRSYQYGENPVTTLEGCITFEGNSPRDILDPGGFLIDSRTGPCPPDMVFLGNPDPPASNHPPPASARPPEHNAPRAEVCDGKPRAVPVGAIACIFRDGERLDVYGINAQSQCFFMVTATQAQINARACPDLVASSADGRAAIFAAEYGDITVSVGPNYEGKTSNVRLGGGVQGAVISIFTTYGPPPRRTGGAGAQICASRLDGCMVRTKYIVNFRDAPNGDLLRFYDIWGLPNDGMLPYNVTLTALERTRAWFKVDYHGTQGWISANYVEPIGNCG